MIKEEEKGPQLSKKWAVNSQVQNGFQARRVVNYIKSVEGVRVQENEGKLLTKGWHIFWGAEKKRLAFTEMKGRLSVDKGGGRMGRVKEETRIKPDERGLVCEVLQSWMSYKCWNAEHFCKEKSCQRNYKKKMHMRTQNPFKYCIINKPNNLPGIWMWI